MNTALAMFLDQTVEYCQSNLVGESQYAALADKLRSLAEQVDKARTEEPIACRGLCTGGCDREYEITLPIKLQPKPDEEGYPGIWIGPCYDCFLEQNGTNSPYVNSMRITQESRRRMVNRKKQWCVNGKWFNSAEMCAERKRLA